MRMRRPEILQILMDWAVMCLCWAGFFTWRKRVEGGDPNWIPDFTEPRLIWGLILIPLSWLLLFHLSNYYRPVHKLKTGHIISYTFVQVLIGGLFVLLVLIPDDISLQYRTYVDSFLYFFLIHFSALLISRFLFFMVVRLSMAKGLLRFPLYRINGGGSEQGKPTNSWPAFIRDNGSTNWDDLYHLLDKEDRPGYFIYLDRPLASSELKSWPRLLSKIRPKDHLVTDPEIYTKIPQQFGLAPEDNLLKLELYTNPVPSLYLNIKRCMDLFISCVALVLLSPLILYLILRIPLGSKGPVFYRQTRIGRYGRPFTIYKFRSMQPGAEEGIPQLSFAGDPRVTRLGKILRRWRLDEIPQFYNVLKGDMSIVGPRPERQYFIDKLLTREKDFPLLLSLRPGITSLGQVKYGYATSLDEICRRVQFDLIYVRNVSLLFDIRIMLETLKVLLIQRKRWL